MSSSASTLPSRRREQSARTRQSVLEAATELISSRGYSGTSISAISRASGVMPASIYWHFESKEGLLAAVIERAADAWFGGSIAAMEEAGGSADDANPPLAGIRYLLREQPEFYRVLLLISLERRDAAEPSLDVVRRVRERCRSLFRSRIREKLALPQSAPRDAICERLADHGMLLLDGFFLAQQIDPLEGEAFERRLEHFLWSVKLARTAVLREAGVADPEGEAAA